MKVTTQGSQTLDEMQRAILDAHNSVMAALDAVGRSDIVVDMVEPIPPPMMDNEVSSVRPRERTGQGVSAHELLAGGGTGNELDTIDGFPLDACGLPVFQADPLNDLFANVGGQGTGLESGAGGSYLERRQIAYFLQGMRENSKALSDLDFYRREEHWDGRYNHDHEARIDESVRQNESDREHHFYSDMERRASNLQSELRFTESQYARDDYAHQQSLRDYDR